MKKCVLCALAIAVVVLALFGVFLVYERFRSGQYYDTGVSDEEYAATASQTPEAKKFLEKYPDAEIYVDRSGALAVDYRVDGQDSYLRLRIFIDAKTNTPVEKFIDCNSSYFYSNFFDYIESTTWIEVPCDGCVVNLLDYIESGRCVLGAPLQVAGFCGTSTFGECSSNFDCMSSGCSGEVCQSATTEEPVITTCEYRVCYDAERYGLVCGCAMGACQWVKR